MGQGFAILIWDSWGAGLVRVNARLLSKGEDMYGNPKNWWPYKTEDEKTAKIIELTDGLYQFDIIE
jgi:hypothetical protein